MTDNDSNLTVFLVSNVVPGDPGGRAEKLASRRTQLAEDGIDIVFGHVPEPYGRTFIPSVLRCAYRARRVGADVVTSVSNPLHLQLVGYAASRAAGAPWIVEFRDPMVVGPDRDPDAPITKLARIVEWLAVTRSDRVVWGDGIQIPDDYFEQRYGVREKATKLPYHGFAPEEFDPVEPADYDEFTITYAGSFYEGWIEPYRFIEGVEQHVATHGRENLRVQFYGDWSEEYQAAVDDADLTDIVEHHEFVPHDEIVPVLKGSDLLLYIGGDDPDNRLNVPSKIWDYVGARTPMLAVVDPSFEVAKLIDEHDIGLVVDPNDTDDIADAINAVRFGEYEYDPDPAVFEFTREAKLDRLSGIYRAVGETDLRSGWSKTV
jgi:glycosyltransferase involved in cell wall biosynthesis